MISIAKRGLIVAVLSLAMVYGCDSLWLRYKMGSPTAGEAFGDVTFYYATLLKNQKLEVFWDQPRTEVCVHSLFPHFGHRPCWYAIRDKVRSIG